MSSPLGKGLLVAGGVSGVAAVAVGVTWGAEQYKDEQKSAGRLQPDSYDILDQVGLQPGVHQNEGGSTWDQDEQDTDATATFSLQPSNATSTLSTDKTTAPVAELHDLDVATYLASNLSTNTNGYMYNQVIGIENLVTSFVLPFNGDSCLFGVTKESPSHIDDQGDMLGFSQGALGFYQATFENQVLKWELTRPYPSLPKIKPVETYFHFLVVTYEKQMELTAIYVDLVSKDEDTVGAPFKYYKGSQIFNDRFNYNNCRFVFNSDAETMLWGGSICALNKNLTNNQEEALDICQAWHAQYMKTDPSGGGGAPGGGGHLSAYHRDLYLGFTVALVVLSLGFLAAGVLVSRRRRVG